jgi:hypothetical protein
MIALAKTLLESICPTGFKISDFPRLIAIKDHSGSKGVHSNFLDVKLNPRIASLRNLFVQKLVVSGKYCNQAHGSPNSREAWNLSNLRAFVKNAEKLLQVIIFLIHITSGLPARGTELTSLLYNPLGNYRRHLFVSDGRVVLFPSYCKTNSMTGSQKYLCRFLEEDVGSLLCAYLALIRPIEM